MTSKMHILTDILDETGRCFTPSDSIYHFTSLSGALGIIDSNSYMVDQCRIS